MESSNLFRSTGVRLTALTPDDLPAMARWHQDPAYLRLYDSRPAYPRSEAELAKWLSELQKDKNTFAFAVRPLGGDELIGYLELDGVDWQHGVCGMTLGIGDRATWGKGYGHEATQALIEKVGFQREGVYREFLQRDGQRHDMVLYGLLRREWEAHRQASRSEDL